MKQIKSKITALSACAALLAVSAAQAAINQTPASAFARVGNAQASGGNPAHAAALVVDLAGTPSIDTLNDALNIRSVLDVAPGALVDSLSYQLTLATVGESWLSEATVLITNSAGIGITLRPGYNLDTEGNASFSGSASLGALNMAFNAGADGKLHFQFFESYDDFSGSVDAVFTAGSITLGGIAVTPVAEPASAGLLALGLLGMAALRRFKARR